MHANLVNFFIYNDNEYFKNAKPIKKPLKSQMMMIITQFTFSLSKYTIFSTFTRKRYKNILKFRAQQIFKKSYDGRSQQAATIVFNYKYHLKLL